MDCSLRSWLLLTRLWLSVAKVWSPLGLKGPVSKVWLDSSLFCIGKSLTWCQLDIFDHLIILHLQWFLLWTAILCCHFLLKADWPCYKTDQLHFHCSFRSDIFLKLWQSTFTICRCFLWMFYSASVVNQKSKFMSLANLLWFAIMIGC